MKFKSIVGKYVSLILRLWNETKEVRAIPEKLLGKEFFTIPWGLWLLLSAIGLVGYLIITKFVWIKLTANIDRVPLTVGVMGALFLGAVGVVNLYVNYRRTRSFEKTTKQQRLSDERRDYQYLYASSFRYLEHEKESVRLSAVYGLIRLAKSSQHSKNPWASDIAKIMSSHIRSITNEDNYQNRNKPSSYISAILRLLIPPTKQNESEKNPFSDLQLDLKDCYLQGANLENLRMLGADLTGADLRGANLTDSDLRSTDLTNVDLTSAILKRVFFGGAIFRDTTASSSALRNDAYLEGADISEIKDIDKVATNQKSPLSGGGGSLPQGGGGVNP